VVDINESYSIPEDTIFYISDLISIVDLDDEVQLHVVDNDNFSIDEDGLITLRENFNGIIDLSFNVSDPFSSVGPFNTTLEILPVNDAPEIIGQLVVPNILPGEKYEILISLLDVIDVDSEDLTLEVKHGENYSLMDGTSILSDANYSGVLNVNLEVSDGLLNSEFVFHIESSRPLGLEREYEFEVYPNPSTDYFKISSFEEIEHIIIYSIEGRKLIDYDCSDLENKENTIQASTLPQGMYIVNILLKSKKKYTTTLIKN
ncbi:MAG: T9SS type A sorting domain-containing protein, partial [Cyclobacteriaceae bacterium]|nr:T9SS type A sorting domain-containing protein [Cyclobacteriaceae bacterium]